MLPYSLANTGPGGVGALRSLLEIVIGEAILLLCQLAAGLSTSSFGIVNSWLGWISSQLIVLNEFGGNGFRVDRLIGIPDFWVVELQFLAAKIRLELSPVGKL